MSDGMDPKNRPVKQFQGIQDLIPLDDVEEIRNRPGMSFDVKWLCDSYATLVLAKEEP